MSYFVEEVLESTNNIFQEYLLDDPVVNKIFEKQLQINPFLMEVIQNLSTKSLQNSYKKIGILENCSVSMNKIFEIHA